MKHHKEHKIVSQKALDLNTSSPSYNVSLHFEFLYSRFWASLVAKMVNNPPAVQES